MFLIVVLFLIYYTNQLEAFIDGDNLKLLSGCVCPGEIVTFECIVCGEGATEWTGSLFGCTSGAITLRHREFGTATGECDSLFATSIKTIERNCSQCFVSQLSFTASEFNANKTVSCIHIVDSTSQIIIDTATIFVTTQSVSPPNDIHISDIGTTHLTFSWSSVVKRDSCTEITYNILAFNCGVCPNSTSSTTAMCTNITADGTTCTFAVGTEVCGNISSTLEESKMIRVMPQVPSAPYLEVEQLFSSFSPSQLPIIYTKLHVDHLNISDGIEGSPTSYTISYQDSMVGTLCREVHLPISSDLCLDLMCTYAFELTMSSACATTLNFTITAFASNIFGDGPSISKKLIVTANSFRDDQVMTEILQDCNCTFSRCSYSDSMGLYLAVSLGSASLLLLALSSVAFIIVTVSLLRSKAKVTRELMQTKGTTDHEPPVTVDYEDIGLDFVRGSEAVSSVISTNDNVAYDHVPVQN